MKEAISTLSNSTIEQAALVGEATVNRMDQTFFETMRIAELFASRISEHSLSQEELEKQMRRILIVSHQNRQEILALAVAYEPNAFNNNKERMLLATHAKDGISIIEGSNYLNKPWYTGPKKTGLSSWQEPFIGDFVTEPIAIYSVPFYETLDNGEKRFAGVICVDLSIAWLQRILQEARIPDAGHAFLLSNTGRIVIHPNKEWIFVETIFSVAEKYNNPTLKELGEKMKNDMTETTTLTGMDGTKQFAYHRPMKSTGWTFGIIFPERYLFAQVGQLDRAFLSIGTIGFLLFIVFIIIIVLNITRPLKRLAKSAKEIQKGNLNTKILVSQRNDEVGTLSSTFLAMRDSLIRQMSDLQATTGAKEKIESELKMAQSIQEGILPQILPPFPSCEYFDLAASLAPARQVGGDLFDFFQPSPTTLCLVIGDVSGKGVPASLFMAVTQTLHRGFAQNKDIIPSQLVSDMNRSLCMNNKAKLFVTYMFAIIDFETLTMSYTNAGHDPFYILKPTGEILDICERHGIPLGVRPNRAYDKTDIKLEIGDTLFFYTDGIPEAKNDKGEFYGMERLKNLLKECAKKNLSPLDIEKTIKQSVENFANGAEQFDDITLLCVKLNA